MFIFSCLLTGYGASRGGDSNPVLPGACHSWHDNMQMDRWLDLLVPCCGAAGFRPGGRSRLQRIQETSPRFLTLTRTLYMSLTDNHNRACDMEAGRIRFSVLGARAMCETLVLRRSHGSKCNRALTSCHTVLCHVC